MNRLTGWFRPAAADPPSLEDQLAALNAASPDLIRNAALNTDDEVLRVAAIHKLPDGQDLRSLATISDEPGDIAGAVPAPVQRAAQERMAELIDAGSLDFAELCAFAKHRPALLSVASLSNDSSRLAQALSWINDPQQIAHLVVEGATSRLRQAAAELVEEPAALRELLKLVRDKDRSVYKILKQKHDILVAAERKAAELDSEMHAVCASLEQHVRRLYDPLYAPTFEHLLSRWRSLAAQPPAALEQRANDAIDRCREVIESTLRQAAQQAAEQAAATAAVQAAHELREREIEASRESAAALAEAEGRSQLEAAAARAAEHAVRAEQQAAAERLSRQIGGLVRAANAALTEGNTQRAAGLRRAIAEKWPVSGEVPVALTRQLQGLDAKLTELKRWKDFAVAPKRIELIEAMEALIGSTEDPKALAERIKALQAEWQTTAKGIASDAPMEWERFHQASRKAYQPCHDYFEAQAKVRLDNLERRKEVLARLTAFEAAHTGDNPDWTLAGRVLREAPEEWRRHFPVERDLGRAVEREFDAAMGRLQAKLDAWYERNAADKQSLIGQARQLLAQDDGREAVEGVKRLQIRWKEIGQGPRHQQQSQWNEFREACDAIFQKRQQAYTEYAVGLEANKAKALALCEEAERVAALTGPALIEGTAKIPEWRTAFDTVGELPRAEARGLQDRFERALDACKAQMAGQRQRDVEGSFASLFEAARHIRAYEGALMGNIDGSDAEALKAAAEGFMAGVSRWPKGGLQALQESLAKADTLSAADNELREKALRTLCIRCEIRSELPTPAEDQALRREYQVQMLMRTMGQGSRADEADWDALLLEWIRIGAIAPERQASLQERFMRCRAVRPRPAERSAERPARASAERSVGRAAGRERESPFGARTRNRRP